MSNWSDLEARVNPVFPRVFGENPATYSPQGAVPPYAITVVFGRPDHIEGLEPAYRHAWAIRTDFAPDPARGDKITIDGIDYVVFQIHPEGGGVWLSLNAA